MIGRPAAALAALALAAGCSLQTLGATTGDMTLHAVFDDVQSLVAGHSVQIADVRVGTVTGIRLEGYRARVTMSVQSAHRVPEGSTATVAKTSVLGENYVQLAPPAGKSLAGGPYLKDGATIAETSVEPDIEQVTAKAGPLIEALGAQDVNAVLDAASTAFAGQGDEVNRLIKQTAQVTDAYAAARRDLGTSIDALARLGDDLAEGSAELDRLPGTLAAATERLAHGRRHVKHTIVALTRLAEQANLTVYPRHAERLRTLLRELEAVSTAMQRGKEDLKALVAKLQAFIDTPPITVNGQVLIYVWLKGLLPSVRGTPVRERGGDFSLLLEPPR
ncbi:phospholipid/cholesterol/gamma-HCH transport system substrate-binding protein [Nonomuraea thailandensis]|uniref:Phospholipid/cholesterol/gamma-HCH transport system substrate-binding protein n=1 Tax=Nonomuraea thailandensis TaxID=1188745 RepID=A0A9X2K3B8_9ACTN|nr:MCE family protein [Nonomuraea thailandensis]MCP2359317.1 phospholipid/cholesterol/gamma-HCH transport system substrate-binding protein [Nonomuraea thailandensis]